MGQNYMRLVKFARDFDEYDRTTGMMAAKACRSRDDLPKNHKVFESVSLVAYRILWCVKQY